MTALWAKHTLGWFSEILGRPPRATGS
jgi:hypothetical protein